MLPVTLAAEDFGAVILMILYSDCCESHMRTYQMCPSLHAASLRDDRSTLPSSCSAR